MAAITQHLIDYPPLRQAHHVAAFMATETEVDLREWIHHHWQQGGTVALPRVISQHGMSFHRYTPDTELINSRFNIAEPALDRPKVPATDLDAVLVPLVAFDSSGTRLGMGGGYYDRFLVKVDPRCWIIGVAFANQYSPNALPKDTWDVPLDAVVTENGVLEWRSPNTPNH
jgi:5-formyltetrahydrofolate cyclo-ligase